MAGDYGRAKEMFLEAVGVEANCIEALFNLGLVNLRLGAVAEANQAFEKLYTILPSASEVFLSESSKTRVEKTLCSYHIIHCVIGIVSHGSNLRTNGVADRP